MLFFVGNPSTYPVIVKVEGNQSSLVENKEIKPATKSQPSPSKVNKTNPLHAMYDGGLRKHRANLKQIMQWSNATPIRRCRDTGYVCCYCDDQYQKPANLKTHTLDVHRKEDITTTRYLLTMSMKYFFIKLDITSLSCRICKKDMITLEELMQHLNYNHKKCIHNDIKNQIIPFKFTTENLECFICKSTFNKFKTLSDHMKVHYRNYLCEKCGAGFVNAAGLFKHSLSHKTGSYKCDFCPKVWDTQLKKKRHETIVHQRKVYQLKCGYCIETFNEYRKRETHLVLVHGVGIPECQACHKVFKTRRTLNFHIKKDHMLEKPHKCTTCDKKFFAAYELKNHMVLHSNLRPHQCSVCKKTFRQKTSLKGHMRIHDNDKRFKCEHCEQAYVQKNSLTYHLKSKHMNIV